MSYSNSGGGTLTLPSPTHVHHVDVTSAVRSLRRSLSRSPSKFRLVAKSPSSSPISPLSPSPPKRASSQPTIFSVSSNPPHTPSPLAVPFPPSAKLALRSSNRAKTAPARPSSRTRTSPKSPMKRVLSQSSDSGNAAPSSSAGSNSGQENGRSTSPAERKSLERASRMSSTLELTAPVNHALSRLGGDGSNDFSSSTTSSPLKRSDAIMNLDQASLGSPVAKRRSLHGSGSFGHDFNVFDHGPLSSPQFDIHDDSNHEYELSATSVTHDSPTYTSMPRRSSSLRKSTLQQRHGEKTSWGRRQAAQALAAQQLTLNAQTHEVSTPVKNRPRLSLDHFMPPMARDSPFSSQGSLPNPSVHMANQAIPQPHPLSRTMTTSSSSSSLVDDSPTHMPPHFADQPRPKLDFSKSLPAGALRPFALDVVSKEENSFATPENYKAVKPLPAAFMSTGLISKVNRNPEKPQIQRGASKNVPDTPCKKQMNGFATYPAPVPGSAIAKARHIRHSFGTPSTPFNPHGNQGAPGTFGKGASVFGSNIVGNSGVTRRGSFLSVDGDDCGASPDAKGDTAHGSTEFELPPTPTKQALVQYYNSGSPSGHRSFPASVSAVGYGVTQKLTRTSSKLNFSTSPCGQEAEDSDGSMDMNDSPTAAKIRHILKSSETVSSSSVSRLSRGSNMQSPSPAPQIPKSYTTAFFPSPSRPSFAKTSHVAPASPLERIEFIEKRSPQTPQESMLPPDPSGLSISNARDNRAAKSGGSAFMPPPATPSSRGDYFTTISDRRLSTTPISNSVPTDVDHSLSARFETVESIGNGEFSFVFKVTQSNTLFYATKSFFSGSSSPTQYRNSPPMPDRVFAVKKSRQPFQGTRDRQRKLQEVEVLKALGRTDHIVHLMDSWEEHSHLYIQTEYCEEGTLESFLGSIGVRGRIDDFRIWKILLEAGQGLQHIHDSGFIHLDLKPANIFITFEGILKIGDFGMATPWPAERGIEGEGDREYIAPEILLGQYDKPADVFALGMIAFEMCGNCVLPDYGPSWQKLRSGDLSDVPSLTFTESLVIRDATGLPIAESDLTIDSYASDDDIETDFGSPTLGNRKRNGLSSKSLTHDPRNLFGTMTRRGELSQPPPFMQTKLHPESLDVVVQGMTAPNPQDRPLIHQVLETPGVRWVASRRRAGATVFEGEWGPADEVLAHDSEMIDV